MLNDYLSHEVFLQKYKTVPKDTLYQNVVSMPFLQAIHAYLFREQLDAGIMRYQKKDLEYQNLERLIQRYSLLISKTKNVDEYLNYVVNLVGLIYMYQPFYYGNSRTCLVLQQLLLHQKGMELRLPDDKIDKSIIAVFYSEDDKASDSTIQIVKQYIRKYHE